VVKAPALVSQESDEESEWRSLVGTAVDPAVAETNQENADPELADVAMIDSPGLGLQELVEESEPRIGEDNC